MVISHKTSLSLVIGSKDFKTLSHAGTRFFILEEDEVSKGRSCAKRQFRLSVNPAAGRPRAAKGGPKNRPLECIQAASGVFAKSAFLGHPDAS